MALDQHLTSDVFGVSRDIPISYVERDHVDDKLLENIIVTRGEDEEDQVAAWEAAI